MKALVAGRIPLSESGIVAVRRVRQKSQTVAMGRESYSESQVVALNRVRHKRREALAVGRTTVGQCLVVQ